MGVLPSQASVQLLSALPRLFWRPPAVLASAQVPPPALPVALLQGLAKVLSLGPC